jgi:hypothetical protein
MDIILSQLEAALVYVLAIAVVVRQLVQYCKPLWQNWQVLWQGHPAAWWVDQFAALLLGLGIAALFQVNAFAEFPIIPIPLGIVATGILAACGSAFVHAILGFLDILRKLPTK